MVDLDFSQHGPGCTPLNPCQKCRFVKFLKDKLAPVDFDKAMYILNGSYVIDGSSTDVSAEILGIRLDSLEFPTRLAGTFKNYEIYTIGDLLQFSERELLRMHGFGKITMKKIAQILKPYNVRVGQFSQR